MNTQKINCLLWNCPLQLSEPLPRDVIEVMMLNRSRICLRCGALAGRSLWITFQLGITPLPAAQWTVRPTTWRMKKDVGAGISPCPAKMVHGALLPIPQFYSVLKRYPYLKSLFPGEPPICDVSTYIDCARPAISELELQ